MFGDYVSIYDFQQSVEDGATVPLFYENRTPELQLVNPDLNEDIYNLIEAAELDPEQEAKLERGVEQAISHPHSRRPAGDGSPRTSFAISSGAASWGDAVVVCIDKATARKMHDKVRKHWAAERERVEQEIAEMTRYSVAADVRKLKSNTRDSLEPPHVGCYDAQARVFTLRSKNWTDEIVKSILY